ncbi:MAG: biotin transporter BioY [Rhizomicrobium sp.]|nr:biotin transporter BioY [Rhizomicrobium sp.]
MHLNPTSQLQIGHLKSGSLALKALAVLTGTALLTLSSYIAVPMLPVPMTLQTLAVTVIGALYGWRLGVLTVIAWLGEAMLGLPVLASGGAGLAPFVGPTAGYLAAFPLAAALTGWLAERGWNGHRPLLAFAAMLLGNALCLAFGSAWLTLAIGPVQALLLGTVPFLVGALVKSALGAALLKSLSR